MFLNEITLAQSLDAAAAATVGIFAILGAVRGALRGVLRIVAGLAALVVARFSAPIVAPFLTRIFKLSNESAHAFAMVIMAALIIVTFGIFLHRYDDSIKKMRLPHADSILGLLLGIAFGAGLMITVVVFTLDAAPAESAIHRGLQQSRTGRISTDISNKIVTSLPSFRDR
ncbi:MAG: CvpA family protein [Planctomycetota bacterium]